MICRVVLGFGMGGEWAAGAALVAETWPARHRGKALALVQSSWAIGYALGAAVVALVMPHFGWRAVFFVGIIPALIALWLRRQSANRRPGSEQRAARTSPDRPAFRGPLAYNMLVCATMNAATLFAWWGLFTWVPRFLSMPVIEGGRGLSIVQTSGWTIVMQVGTFLGYISLRLHRRPLQPQIHLHWVPAHCHAAGAALCIRTQSECAAVDRPTCRLLWHGIFQRIQRHRQRTLSDRPARLRDGVCLQHRPRVQRSSTLSYWECLRTRRIELRALHHLCRISGGGPDRDRFATASY